MSFSKSLLIINKESPHRSYFRNDVGIYNVSLQSSNISHRPFSFAVPIVARTSSYRIAKAARANQTCLKFAES